MKIAMQWLFIVLLVKLLLNIIVIQIKLLFLRTNCTVTEEDSMCYHHEEFYLSLFQNLQQYCSDPWKQHSKQIKKDLWVADIETAQKVNLKPGQKLCRQLWACGK